MKLQRQKNFNNYNHYTYHSLCIFPRILYTKRDVICYVIQFSVSGNHEIVIIKVKQ